MERVEEVGEAGDGGVGKLMKWHRVGAGQLVCHQGYWSLTSYTIFTTSSSYTTTLTTHQRPQRGLTSPLLMSYLSLLAHTQAC